jgi:hypothetical protein
VTDYDLLGHFSPSELSFVEDPAPDHHTATQFVWRYEALWVLLWALGHIDDLSWPEGICDVPRACAVVRDAGATAFVENATLRPTSALLEEADFIYRLHWATRNATLSVDAQNLAADGGVVMERHWRGYSRLLPE